VNLCLGETYTQPGKTIKSKQLQLNTRPYDIGNVPEKMSLTDGNGKIILLTCAADLGGRVIGINSEYDDVRLDYEVLAHCESGSTYSITHGSIGTFVPGQTAKQKEEDQREYWSYDISKPNNVWKEFDKVLGTIFKTDTGRNMQIFFTGIDTGFSESQVFDYIDRSNFNIIGLKGDKEHKHISIGDTSPNFKIGLSRTNLFLLKVGKLKDSLAARINLRWAKNTSDPQPPGFLNFPQPSGGKYGLENYFLHFEAEHRVLDKKNGFIWEKKTPSAQNHLFDCRIYNMAVRDILVYMVAKELKQKLNWQEYCDIVLGRKS